MRVNAPHITVAAFAALAPCFVLAAASTSDTSDDRIALSANALPRDIEKSLEAGFFNYLTKPIKVDRFMDALDAALKFSQAAASATAGRAAETVQA